MEEKKRVDKSTSKSNMIPSDFDLDEDDLYSYTNAELVQLAHKYKIRTSNVRKEELVYRCLTYFKAFKKNIPLTVTAAVKKYKFDDAT